jgi:hypothetical protein
MDLVNTASATNNLPSVVSAIGTGRCPSDRLEHLAGVFFDVMGAMQGGDSASPALTFTGVGYQRGAVQDSAQSNSNTAHYFRPEQTSTPVFAVILPHLGEKGVERSWTISY